MKELILDLHTHTCDIEKRNHPVKDKYNMGWCFDFNCQNDKFLFFAGNDFYLLNHYMCQSAPYCKFRFYEDVIENVFINTKIFKKRYVERTQVNEDLKNYRIRGKALKKYIQQINYLYSDNAKVLPLKNK